MKNVHTIYHDWDIRKTKVLEKYGLAVAPGFNRLVLEEDEIYQKLLPYFVEWKVNDYVISKFSDTEFDNAIRLILLSPWANGYPMPDGDGGYKRITYNNSSYCNTCGIGLVQKEPFRLKQAPKWSGHKKMFSLNWVYDELFVKKDFYDELFKPLGIQSKEVLLYKKETVIEDTVQLIIPEVNVSLNLEGYQFQICKDCNRKRYDLINVGFFPSFYESPGSLQIFKSKEWFGTGASARKYVFVSQEFRRELVKRKVSANYIPCQN